MEAAGGSPAWRGRTARAALALLPLLSSAGLRCAGAARLGSAAVAPAPPPQLPQAVVGNSSRAARGRVQAPTAEPPASAAPVAALARRGASAAAAASTRRAGSTAGAEGRTGAKVPFNPLDYAPAVGKVFVFYYSRASQELVTPVEARNYQPLATHPSDELVYEPSSGRMISRGSCPLRLAPPLPLASSRRKANLRLAELAVCQAFNDSPCVGETPGCELEVLAPLPYDDGQEPYIAAGMALVAHSKLCALHADALTVTACEIKRSKAAVSAGLRPSARGSVELLPLPGAWVDLKLDAAYSLGFSEAVFAAGNHGDYLAGDHHATKDNVLAWERKPPEPVFCEDLSCLVQKFEQR
mmetsp:Transcript_83193/g.230900  ORF Transcript_83193/g.230900 Transcript_83193/m.230900 type:complete len:355 (+) Transcript_83193:38-1102(+)